MKKFRKGRGEKPSFLKQGEDELDDEAFPVIAEMEKDSGSSGKGAHKRSGPKEKSKKRQQKVNFCATEAMVFVIGHNEC